MQTQTPNYVIYNASAGSGKTYGLVKAFLKIVLAQQHPEAFRSLLAITFTNKAVYEMKTRVIEMLTLFSEEKILTDSHPMFDQLCQELTTAPAEMQKRAQAVLMQMLHNYASLSIYTIDGFNQRLIRNFAFDLRLNQFFEIQLDSEIILKRAVDNLMQRAGDDIELTDLLTDFANDKIDEDKNWDSTAELLKVAKMLTVENHYEPLASLKNKDLNHFRQLKQNLTAKRNDCIAIIKKTVSNFLNLCAQNNLGREAFSRGSVFNFFYKLNENPNNEPAWGAKWQIEIEDKPLYAASSAKSLDTATIDQLQPTIIDQFYTVKETFSMLSFYRNALQTIVPLALLNRLQTEIEIIKEEENILPIWEFNGVISDEITSQPAPFIYERIGERYRHYFIDEFQDTSVLQWKNFIPLILNAVQSENNSKQRGSALLVGDAKQSIYRWRGGKAEQFMALYSGEENPFYIPGEVHDLAYNFRSLPAIIHFNNDFFNFISDKFEDEKYRQLYAKSGQYYPPQKQEQNLPEGYLNIRFVSKEPTEEINYPVIDEKLSPLNQNYCLALWDAITEANRAGVPDKDICILVRKKAQGVIVASFLSANKRKVVSSDSLLLNSMPSVRFIINLLYYLYLPDNQERKVEMLLSYTQIKSVPEIHTFISHYTEKSLDDFLDDFDFSLRRFVSYSFYEGVAYIVQVFDLAQSSDAYLTYFLDVVYDFKSSSRGGIADFLEYWEEKKDELSISSPEGIDAISIMTVHKSKGLSAPVIIVAFADSPLTGKSDEMLWYPVEEREFSGFSNLLVKNVKSLETYQNDRHSVVKNYRSQYFLDEINVLYVAMTRPESFLYIITQDSPKSESYGSLFREYLQSVGQWNENVETYTFGTPIYPQKKEKTISDDTILPFVAGNDSAKYIIATRSSMLWDSARGASIERGNVIHDLLSRIVQRTDLDNVLHTAVKEGILSETQQDELKPLLYKLLHHDELGQYFTEEYDAFAEREFIDAQGNYFRPDRIARKRQSGETIIIDYKTGIPNSNHHSQITQYAHNLTDMGWNIVRKYLVYIQDQWLVEEV